MRKLTSAVLIIGFVGCVLLCLDFGIETRWDGAFPLQVRIVGPGERNLGGVSADVIVPPSELHEGKNWDQEIQKDPRRFELRLKPVNISAQDRTFSIDVPCSGRLSGLHRNLGYYQFRLVVLLVQYSDGKQRYVTADIPDGRVEQTISVWIPGNAD